MLSLSARRAWIEIWHKMRSKTAPASLSARRAWIEMFSIHEVFANFDVALRKESVDRNFDTMQIVIVIVSRSPQGERG